MYTKRRGIEPLIVHELEEQRNQSGDLTLVEDLLRYQQMVRLHILPTLEAGWLIIIIMRICGFGRIPIEWSPRSSHLIKRHLESVIYKTLPESIEELSDSVKTSLLKHFGKEERSIKECKNITPETFFKVSIGTYLCEEFGNGLSYY